MADYKWAPSSEFVSSSIPSLQILTAHAQPFRWARDLAFCLKVSHDSLLVWVSSGGSGETAWMRRLAWTFAARIGDKYQIRLTWSKCQHCFANIILVYYCLCIGSGGNLKYIWITLMILTFGQTGSGKQCRPRSDCSWSGLHYLSHITWKRVVGIFDQVRFKPACSATETN